MTILFERYEIQKKLGRGSSGTVYLCKDQMIGNIPVAVKLLPAWLLDRPVMRARLASEILSLHKIQSEQVVGFYELMYDAHNTAIVMEYARGRSLRELLDAGELVDLSLLYHLGSQLLKGIAEIHRLGLIHRDIKPENLIVSDSGALKIVDLGLVTPQKHGGNAIGLLESSGSDGVPGTPLYLSPEYIRGKILTERTDVFAAAMVIFELFARQQLFDAQNEEKLLEDKCFGYFSNAFQTLTPKMQKFIRRGAHPIPMKRFQNGEAMLEAFQRIEQQAGHKIGAPLDSGRAGERTAVRRPSQALYVAAKAVEFSFLRFFGNVNGTRRLRPFPLRPRYLFMILVLLGIGAFAMSEKASLLPTIQKERGMQEEDTNGVHVPRGYRLIRTTPK